MALYQRPAKTSTELLDKHQPETQITAFNKLPHGPGPTRFIECDAIIGDRDVPGLVGGTAQHPLDQHRHYAIYPTPRRDYRCLSNVQYGKLSAGRIQT